MKTLIQHLGYSLLGTALLLSSCRTEEPKQTPREDKKQYGEGQYINYVSIRSISNAPIEPSHRFLGRNVAPATY